VPHVDYDTLTEKKATSPEGIQGETERVREQILRARARQAKRFHGLGISTNGEMTARDIEECIELTPAVRELLKRSAEKLDLSPRSYHRLIKVSRTIADLDDKDTIEDTHVLEALHFRSKS
jgi:magnesium chelatase family protein